MIDTYIIIMYAYIYKIYITNMHKYDKPVL